MNLAIILGGAENVTDDVRALERLMSRAAIVARPTWIAVNDVGAWWPGPIGAWVTLHARKLAVEDPDDPDGWSWEDLRRSRDLPGGYTTYAQQPGDASWVHEIVSPWGGGSVSMYAVRIAHYLGATHTVLCGCPLDKRPCTSQSRSEHTVTEGDNLKTYRRGWKRRLAREHSEPARYMRTSVRSMSGWTARLIGEPTVEWLQT